MRSLDPPHQERHGDCEEGVLDELEVADEVVLEEGIVDRRRAKRLEGEPEEQREPGDPGSVPPQPARPKAYGKDEGRDDDDEHGEVERRTSIDVEPSSTELRLVLLVEEQKGDGNREGGPLRRPRGRSDREGFALGR